MTKLFQNGFEEGDYSQWLATVASAPNTLTPVSSPVFRGSYASEIVASDGLWAESEKASLGSNNYLYLRAYVRLASVSMSNLDRFEVLMVVNSASGERARAQVYQHSDGNLYWRFACYFGSGSQTSGNLLQIVLGQWYCIELYYIRSASSEEGQMWIDGVLKSTLTGSSASAETLNRIFCGFHDHDGVFADPDSTTFEIDNVVAADAYIGLLTPALLVHPHGAL